MSVFARFLFATTAFGPTLLLYALMCFGTDRGGMGVVFGAMCATLVIVWLGLLALAKSRLSLRRYKIETVENANQKVLAFLLISLLPLIVGDWNNFNWIVWVLIIFCYCLVATSSREFHFHPLLAFFGYHCHRVNEKDGTPHILIAKRRRPPVGEPLTVVRFAPHLLIDKTA